MGCLTSLPAAAEDASERVRRILDRGDYQTDLPVDPPALPLPPGTTGPLAAAMFWVGVVLVLAFVLWMLARELGFGGPAASVPGESSAPEGDDDPSVTIADADRLASDGRFDEAVHLLLLVAIRRLSRESGREPRASSTARELIRAFPLPPDRRGAFAHLVRTVEWSLFGGRAVDAGEYSRCREFFRGLVPAG